MWQNLLQAGGRGEGSVGGVGEDNLEFVFALRRLEIAGRKLHGENGKVLADQLPQVERALETGLADCEIHKHQLDERYRICDLLHAVGERSRRDV